MGTAPPARKIDLWFFSWSDHAPVARTDDRRLGLLSPSERARVRSCGDPRTRDRLTDRQGLLRGVLARYVGASPAALELAPGAHGKPRLIGPCPDAGFEFNLSHTSRWLLVACAVGAPVGADIERIRAGRDLLGLARRYFNASEAAHLGSLPAARREAAFYRLWTAKEALLKATGHGFSLPSRTFETGTGESDLATGLAVPACVSAPEPLTVARIHDSRWGRAEQWCGLRFRLGNDHCGCVATRSPAAAYGFPQLAPDWGRGWPPTDFDGASWLDLLLDLT